MNIANKQTGSNYRRTLHIAALLWAVSGVQTCFAQVQSERINARIGQRASIRTGERSAIRWLSYLIKQKPDLKFYVVEYSVPLRGVEVGFFMSYDTKSKGLQYTTRRHESIADKSRSNISARKLHSTARKGGTFKDL